MSDTLYITGEVKKKMATILVCDDDKDIVEAISIYLEQEGHQILKAYDGQQALLVLQKNEVDLLIIDVMMPKLDGISFRCSFFHLFIIAQCSLIISV